MFAVGWFLLAVSLTFHPSAVSPPPSCAGVLVTSGVCGKNTGTNVILVYDAQGNVVGYRAPHADPEPPNTIFEGSYSSGTGDYLSIDCSSQPLPCNALVQLPPESSASPGPSIRDVATFSPVQSIVGMEPATWIVLGLDTNFYATSERHIRSGTLLGSPAEVEFIAVGHRWDYGDGTSKVTTSGGSPRATRGVAEFAATETSHVHTQPGTYTINHSIIYVARTNYGPTGEWWDLAGTLEIPSAPITAEAIRVKTVLVDQNCNSDPSGPGC